MLAFNPFETLLFNTGINTFSIIITILILYAYKKNFTDTYDVLLLRKLEIMILLILSSDIIMWVLNGNGGKIVHVISYFNVIVYFLLQIAVVREWLRYAHYRIYESKLSSNKELIGIILPLSILAVLVVTAPINGWCFTIDEANLFHRGWLSIPMSLVLLIYLLLVSVFALKQFKKEVMIDRKRELIIISLFVIPPFIGGAIQTVLYGISVIWPSSVISSLLVLLNKDSQAMSRDALTGLNNRRNMERFLASYDSGSQGALTVILIDINDFKHINDEYGHNSGDLALIQVANILRTTLNNSTSFLGRYGGDEFVIILPQVKDSLTIETILKIKENLMDFNDENKFPFRLSVSVGYAVSSNQSNNWTDLFNEADRNMYQDKSLHHRTTLITE